MSIRIEDYIPFDYMRYAGEILPALEQATRGNTIPLSALITMPIGEPLCQIPSSLCPLERTINGQACTPLERY